MRINLFGICELHVHLCGNVCDVLPYIFVDTFTREERLFFSQNILSLGRSDTLAAFLKNIFLKNNKRKIESHFPDPTI